MSTHSTNSSKSR